VCQRQGRERAENTNDPTGIEILDLRCPKNTHNINSPVVCFTRFIAIAPVGPPVSKKSPFPVTVHSIRLLAQHCRVLIVSGPLRKVAERLYWRRAFFNSSSIRILKYLLQQSFLHHFHTFKGIASSFSRVESNLHFELILVLYFTVANRSIMPPKRSNSRPRRSGPPQGDDDDDDDNDGDDDGDDGAPPPSEDAPTNLNQSFFSTEVYKLTVQAVSPPTGNSINLSPSE